MVQIYRAGNENFSNNGDAVLICFACNLNVELNGTWVLELDIPIDKEGRWKYVTENAVLKVPTWQADEQLYRISSYDMTETGIHATAYPIFYDSAKDAFLLDKRPTNKNGQEALDIMTDGTPYSARSDILTENTAYFVRRNLLDAICGEDEPTFHQIWGGEILFDNYTIVINNRVGGDYGVEVRYGKNMEGVRYSVDTSAVVTRIIPVAYNGRMMSGAEPWVDSQYINAYPIVYTKEVTYDAIRMAEDVSGSDNDDITVCSTQEELDAALRAAAEVDFASGCDAPAVTLDIDMKIVDGRTGINDVDTEPLADTDSAYISDTNESTIETSHYVDYAKLEKVRLGDTVHCRHRKLDIASTARVIALTWDCIRKTVTHVTLGDYKYNYVAVVSNAIQRANSVIREDGTVIADKIQGFINGQNTMFRTQYDLATRMDTMAILFENFDTESDMYGALGIGTQGLCISKTRTEDGRDWVWTTGATANGLNAEMGVFGILADKMGYNYINMDTGDLHFGSQTEYIEFDPETGHMTLNVQSLSINGTSVSEGLADAAKTATNYLWYTEQDGLVVKCDTDTVNGYNTQITSDGINFRDGEDVLATVSGSSYVIYQYDNNTIPAMELDSEGLKFYETNHSTVAAAYTAYGLEVKYGRIGGFEIDETSIHTVNVEVTDNSANSIAISSAGFAREVGGSNIDNLNIALGANFGVTSNGSLYAYSGILGGWHIDRTAIHSASSHDPYVILSPSATGNDDIFSVRVGGNTYPFWIHADGYMHAAQGDIGKLIITPSANGTQLKSGANGTAIDILSTGVISVVGVSVWGDISVTNGNIYINGSPISTSDKRMKKDWMPFDERYENAYMEMQPVRFMFRNFTEDDHHDRFHCGFLAQDVEETFSRNGITNDELGLLCIKSLEEPNKGGYMTEYGLRYEEMVALNVHMIQKLYARINELERRLIEGGKI